MSKVLFKDPALQATFLDKGYVVIPLFQQDEIEELLAIFNHYFKEELQAFYSSSYLNDFEQKKEISEAIKSVIVKKLDNYFINYRCIGGAFLSKSPGKYSELPMHQDWTIVDEEKYVAVNIWTPLTPITSENGTLQVLPESHKKFRILRAPTLPFSGEGYQELLKNHLVSIFPKQGEVVVLDQALIHYSDQNKSDSIRVAVTTGVVSKEAQLHFHYWNKNSETLEKFEQDDDFLLKFENFHQSIFQRPTFGKIIKSEHYSPAIYSKQEIDSFLKIEEKKESLFHKFFSKLIKT